MKKLRMEIGTVKVLRRDGTEAPRNIETCRATLDHLHLEALAERGFVSAAGDNAEFILDLKLTGDAVATLRLAYWLLGEKRREKQASQRG